ncbi:MAG: hypothetical protein WD885_01210 [Candidatus Saccharimonadales bacterium]
MKLNKSNFFKNKMMIYFAIILLIALSVFSIKEYLDYRSQAKKVYFANEIVKLPDFELKINKTELKPVDLPFEENVVKKYGNMDKQENCKMLSDTVGPYTDFEQAFIDSGGSLLRNSPLYDCELRNKARNEIKKYSEEHQQIVIDYVIQAFGNVDTSKLKITLLPDSGRDVEESVFTDNPFIWFGSYNPYFQDSLEGNINTGISRTGYVYTDVRKTEKVIDIIVNYEKDGEINTKLVRINL